MADLSAAFDRPVVCPVLVGRAPCLQVLDGLITQVLSGVGQTALIAGEAGIGKSRLVAEMRQRGASHGMLSIRGNCFETDSSLPYAPVLDLLNSLYEAQSPEEIARYWTPAAPELVKIMPWLGAHLPGVAPTPPLEPEQEKRRLFEALVTFFANLSEIRPLMIVIEDLHWTDDTSLDFLLYFARRISSQRTLLLITYRSDEAHVRLSHFLATVERERIAGEMELARLGIADVDAMIHAIFDMTQPTRAEFLSVLYSLTEGNPFFIEEVLKSLTAEGGIFYAHGAWDRKPINELRIPRTVQDAVGRRSEQLSEGAREVLALAAVAGQRFHFDILQDLTHQDERTLLRLLKELISAQLVVETSADQFAFRHALTRQAVYTSLLARERKALHRDIAEAMERLSGGADDARLADMAYHYYEAEEWAKALEYGQRAGERAQSLYALGAALESFTRALDAAARLGVTPPLEVYRARGLAYETLGDFDSALADYEAALEAARVAGDRHAEWQALVDLGFLWAGRDYSRAGDYFMQALELARGMGDEVTLAHSLNRLANWFINTGQAKEGLRHHDEALHIFQSRNDKRGTADTLDLLGMASGIFGDVRSSMAHLREAIVLSRELKDTRLLIESLTTHCAFGCPSHTQTVYASLHSKEECLHDGAEALRLARQIGWLAGQSYTEFALGSAYASFGDFGQGIAHGEESLRIATEIGHRQWIAGAHNTLGRVYVLMLDGGAAIKHLSVGLPLAYAIGSSWWIGLNASQLAIAHLLNADIESAESVLRAAMPEGTPPRNLQERNMLWASGEVALAKGEPQAALAIAERLTETAPGGGGDYPIPHLLKLKGNALLTLGQAAKAEEALEAAKRGAIEQQCLPLLWQIHEGLSRVHQELKNTEKAQAEAIATRRVVSILAETISDLAQRNHFVEAALGVQRQQDVASPRRSEATKPGGLTGRELETALLVAQGKSNREIADTLFIGERTVETHVSNILSKLGFTTRSQVAAWAVTQGLGIKDKTRLDIDISPGVV